MGAAFRAGLAYFAIMFGLGFLLGTLRVLVLVPHLGEGPAVLLELPVMLALSWVVAGWLIRGFGVEASAGARLLMGAVALFLLYDAEVLLGVTLFGRSLADQVAAMLTGWGLLGTLAQLLFGLFPLAWLLRGR